MEVPRRAGLPEAVRIREIWVRNFKSLRDVRVKLRGFNLLIGPNRSGKTNFLEALKLLRAIYFPGPGEEVNPFLPWWSYDRVVWRRDEKLPITIGLGLDVMGYRVDFETTFTGVGGTFSMLKEVIDIKDIVRLERRGRELRITHSRDFLDTIWGEVEAKWEDVMDGLRFRLLHRTSPELYEALKMGKETLSNYVVNVWDDFRLLRHLRRPFIVEYGSVSMFSLKNMIALVISPRITIRGWPRYRPYRERMPLIEAAIRLTGEVIRRSLILRPVETRRIRETIGRPTKEDELSEDALNLHNVLFNLWIQNGGRLPDRIEAALKDIFGPDVRVAFELTTDGRLFMRVFEGDLRLDPPMISDGFYKVLTILTAVEIGPSILAIDELENSLHLEAIERVLDDLRNAGCVVVATTHSPLVIDQVDPADIIFVDRDEEGATIMWRVKDPEALKRKLAEKGITLSEGWLYGRIR